MVKEDHLVCKVILELRVREGLKENEDQQEHEDHVELKAHLSV